MSALNRGEVSVTLSGTVHTLKPTLTAFSNLGSRYENYGELLGKIASGNVPAMVSVLRNGLGMNDAQAKTLPEKVWSTGVEDLKEPLSDFVFRLFNSGKSPDELLAARTASSGDLGGKEDADNDPLLQG